MLGPSVREVVKSRTVRLFFFLWLARNKFPLMSLSVYGPTIEKECAFRARTVPWHGRLSLRLDHEWWAIHRSWLRHHNVAILPGPVIWDDVVHDRFPFLTLLLKTTKDHWQRYLNRSSGQWSWQRVRLTDPFHTKKEAPQSLGASLLCWGTGPVKGKTVSAML